VNLRNGSFRIAKPAQLSLLFAALPLQRGDIGANRRKLPFGREVVLDCATKLDDDEDREE